MNLAATISLYAYGTSEGVRKEWDTRGRRPVFPGGEEAAEFHNEAEWLDKSPGSRSNPIDVGDNIKRAAKLIAENKHVTINQPNEVVTLIDKIKKDAAIFHDEGKPLPDWNLADISIKGKNLFARDNVGIPRVDMPQLAGRVDPGSPAAALLPKDAGPLAEVDLAPQFIKELQDAGIGVKELSIPASQLRSTQEQLDGMKVAGIAGAIAAGKIPPSPIFVTRDNYIIDGHHRWAAQIVLDAKNNREGDIQMPVHQLNIDIGTALTLATAFQKRWGISKTKVSGGNKEEWLPDEVQAYGTSEGVKKEWDTRGRKPVDQVDIEDAFGKINKVYQAVDRGMDLDEEDKLDAQYAVRDLLSILMDENKMYLGRKTAKGYEYKALQAKYKDLSNKMLSRDATLTDLDNAVNVMHVDFKALQHYVWENEQRLENKADLEDEEIDPKDVEKRTERLEEMANFFDKHRIGAIKKVEANRKLHKRVKFQGLDISVENRAGSTRTGKDPYFGPWKTKMRHDYGYVKGSKGMDGGGVDCFVGPNPAARFAYVVHILKGPKFQKFDEDKVMLGFNSKDAAKKAFMLHYDNKKFYGGMDALLMNEFKRKVLQTGKTGPKKIHADAGEPGVYPGGYAHIEPRQIFRPPSLKNTKPVPVDDPMEKDDQFGDVSRRRSKETIGFRDRLTKRKGSDEKYIGIRTTQVSGFPSITVGGFQA